MNMTEISRTGTRFRHWASTRQLLLSRTSQEARITPTSRVHPGHPALPLGPPAGPVCLLPLQVFRGSRERLRLRRIHRRLPPGFLGPTDRALAPMLPGGHLRRRQLGHRHQGAEPPTRCPLSRFSSTLHGQLRTPRSRRRLLALELRCFRLSRSTCRYRAECRRGLRA
jgi:hypothetical protein